MRTWRYALPIVVVVAALAVLLPQALREAAPTGTPSETAAVEGQAGPSRDWSQRVTPGEATRRPVSLRPPLNYDDKPPLPMAIRVVPTTVTRPDVIYEASPETRELAKRMTRGTTPRKRRLKTLEEIREQERRRYDAVAPGPASMPFTDMAAGRGLGPVPQGQAPVPTGAALGFNTTFDSFDFNFTGTLPPDSHMAAGPTRVMGSMNSLFAWYEKDGTFDAGFFLGGFFTIAQTGTFDPRLMYDQYEDRWIVLTLEAFNSGGIVSRILLAVSDTGDPNGTWTQTSIDTNVNFPAGGGGPNEGSFNDYPALGLDDEALYVTTNQFGATSGFFRGVRIWVVEKGVGTGGLYDGTPGTAKEVAPPGTLNFNLSPAKTYGVHPDSTVGTYITSYERISTGPPTNPAFLQVFSLRNPTAATPTVTQSFVDLGPIDNFNIAVGPAPQPLSGAGCPNPPGGDGLPNCIDSGGPSIFSNTIWRDGFLYVATEIIPTSGADAGHGTVHWAQIAATGPTVAGSATDQGDAGAEDIATDTETYYPSLAVDANGSLGISFGMSGPNLNAGAGFAFRTVADPPGTVQATETLRSGLSSYELLDAAPGPGARNRWGDYTGTDVDPATGCFWSFNQYVEATNVWGTAFGELCFDSTCGNSVVEPGETCDPPGAPAGQPDECRANCTFCGDDAVQAGDGEECDDGNNVSGDGCTADCLDEFVCGDGDLDPDETCDPPGLPAGQPDECRDSCTFCGDGNRELGEGELCDDGNNTGGDGCAANCSLEFCGDGVVLGPETCDFTPPIGGGGTSSCRADCTFCGDGLVNGNGNLIANGNFESGTLFAWTLDNVDVGTFALEVVGSLTDATLLPTADNPAGVEFYTVSDMGGPGTNAISQPFTVPVNATSVVVEYDLFVNNWNIDGSGAVAPFGTFVDPAGLDHTVMASNQHARVDIMNDGFGPMDTSPAGVERNLYIGADPDPGVGPLTPNPYTSHSLNLTSQVTRGNDYNLRFANTDNEFILNVGLDNVRVLVTPLETCDDGNNLPGDTCQSFCEPCPAAIFPTVRAINKDTFRWPPYADVTYVVGDLATVSTLSGTQTSVAFTRTIDASAPPAPGGDFYVVRYDCPGSSWGTGGIGEAGDRDATLP